MTTVLFGVILQLTPSNSSTDHSQNTMITHALACIAASDTTTDSSHYTTFSLCALGGIGVVWGVRVSVVWLALLLILLHIRVLVTWLAVLLLAGGAIALSLLWCWGAAGVEVSNVDRTLMISRHTSIWNGPEDCLHHTDRTAVRTGRAGSRLAEEDRRNLHVLVGHSPVVPLRTEGREEPGHNLADRTGPEVDNLVGRNLAEDTGCKGPTWCVNGLMSCGGYTGCCKQYYARDGFSKVVKGLRLYLSRTPRWLSIAKSTGLGYVRAATVADGAAPK